MGSGESTPSIDSPEKIKRELRKRQRNYEESLQRDLESEAVQIITPHKTDQEKEREREEEFMTDVLGSFENEDWRHFDRTTTKILKMLQPLDLKFVSTVLSQMWENEDITSMDGRWRPWIQSVQEMYDGIYMDEPLPGTRPGAILAYNYVTQRGWNPLALTFTQMQRILLLIRDDYRKLGGVTGEGVWVYDVENEK